MSLWKKMVFQTKSKAFEKLVVERIVQEPGQGLLNPSKKNKEFDLV